MSHTHTIVITTENPVDAPKIQNFLDACGYLMTGYLGADAVVHATWNVTNEPVTPGQLADFGAEPLETVGALKTGARESFGEMFGLDDE